MRYIPRLLVCLCLVTGCFNNKFIIATHTRAVMNYAQFEQKELSSVHYDAENEKGHDNGCSPLNNAAHHEPQITMAEGKGAGRSLLK